MANRIKHASDLFSLVPRRQLVDIFSDWLKIGDIGRFDSAACNTTIRKLFLDLIQADCYVFPGMLGDACNGSFFEWSVQRRLKFTQLIMGDESIADDDNLRHDLLVHTGKSVKFVAFCSDRNTEEEPIDDDSAILRRSATTQQAALDIAEFCPNLTQLEMSGNMLDGAFCQLLTRCTRLQYLNISKCAGVSNSILRCLCNLPDLQVLLMSNTRLLSDALDFRHKPCLSLQTLRAEEHGNIPLKDMTAFICLFPNLTELCVDRLDPPSLLQIVQACPLITKADLTVTRAVPEATVQLLASTWHGINELSLEVGGPRAVDAVMSEASMLAVVTQCKYLKQLVLRRSHHRISNDVPIVAHDPVKSALRVLLCERVTTPTLRSILSMCPNLHMLGISQPSLGHTVMDGSNPLELLKGTAVKSLLLDKYALAPTSLNPVADMLEIVLDGCSGVTAPALASLAQRSPRLEKLIIRKCRGVTAAALIKVVSFCPELQTLVFLTLQERGEVQLYQLRTPKCDLMDALLRKCCPRLTWISIF